MNRWQFLTGLSLLAVVMPHQVAEAQKEPLPQPSDYAWGFPIRSEGESSFFTIQLPLEVNQSVTDPELRDAGVYNANGEPVPRIFLPASDDVEKTERRNRLTFLPLFATTEARTDDIRMVFEREGDSTRLELNSTDLLQADNEQLTSYIVDTRPLKESIEALELEWSPVSAGFIGTVSIDGSANLEDWSAIGSGAVADLRQDSTSIVQRRVVVKPSNHDYLRIRWDDLPDDWRLTAVSGEYSVGVPNVVQDTITLESSGTDSADGGRIFELGGAPKVDRFRVLLTEPNTVISARVYFWSESQQRWAQAERGSYHYIGKGQQSVRNDWSRLDPVRTRRLKIVQTSGQPDAAMQLEIRWRPDTLLFLAQGRGPFTLVAGSARDAESGYPQQRMFGDRAIAKLATGTRTATSASLGSRYPLGGPESLTSASPPDWRKIALWLGLGLGVAFVGFMASRVIRELKSA